MSGREKAILLVASAAAMTSIGCRQILGLDGQASAASVDGGPEAGTSACGLPWGTTACAACMQTSCCAESTACAGDPACAPFEQCFGACGSDDWACRAQCWADHPAGPTATPAPLVACTSTSCAAECGMSCGSVGIAAGPDAAAGCVDCLTSSGSCTAERACTSSAECIQAGLCWASCFGSPDCTAACAPPSEAGAALYYAAGYAFSSCGTACAVQVNWNCVGHVKAPAPTSSGSALAVYTGNLISYDGVSGVDVEACYAGDPACSAPYAHGVTEPSPPPAGIPLGTTTYASTVLQVPASLGGHGLEAGNYLQLTSPDVAPVLFFWGFSVSRPGENFIIGLAPQAQWQQWLGQAVTWDPSRGLVIFSVSDCTPPASAAIGVRVDLDSSDAAVREFYVQGGITPSFSARETDGTGGIARLGGGFVNVSPGTVTLTATPVALGRVASRATVLVRAGTVTLANLLPGP